MTLEQTLQAVQYLGMTARHPDMPAGYVLRTVEGTPAIQYPTGRLVQFVPGLIEAQRDDWDVIGEVELDNLPVPEWRPEIEFPASDEDAPFVADEAAIS